MLNCSFSLKAFLCKDEDVVDLDEVVPQKLFFSVGEGGTKTPESLISALTRQRPESNGGVALTPTAQLVFHRLLRVDIKLFAAGRTARLRASQWRWARARILILLAKRVLDDSHVPLLLRAAKSGCRTISLLSDTVAKHAPYG